MHRIDADGHVANMFTDRNPATGQPGTYTDDDWLNAVQEEFCGGIEGAGLTLSKGQNSQLFAATALGASAKFARYFWDETTIAGFQGYDVLWVDELSLFVAVGIGSTDKIITSPDGASWTSRLSFSSDTLHSVAWSPSLSRLVAVGSNGRVYYSSNGTSWTNTTFPGVFNSMRAVVWADGLSLFVAVGNTGVLSTSSDGITWVDGSMPVANEWSALCWSEELGVLVAGSTSGDGASSINGTSWTSRTMPSVSSWQSIAWAPYQGVFLAVNPVNDTSFAYSEDGLTWSAGVMDAARQQYHVAWIPDLLCFVACGVDSVARTPDLVHWEDSTVSSAIWSGNTWGTRARRLVAVSQNTANVAAMS